MALYEKHCFIGMKIQTPKRGARALELLLLRELSIAGRSLSAYVILKRFHLSPAALTGAISRLGREEYIVYEKNALQLTAKGRSYIDSHLSSIAIRKETIRADIPEKFKQIRLAVNEPYLPNTAYLDRTAFLGRMDRVKR